MQATFKNKENSGKVAANRKEKHFYMQYTLAAIAHDDNNVMVIKELMQARWYATQSTHYCCLWVHNHPYHVSGGGKAGGYGYHRASAALQNALTDAKIVLDQDIDGRGDGIMEETMLAIGAALGFGKCTIIKAFA